MTIVLLADRGMEVREAVYVDAQEECFGSPIKCMTQADL